METPETKGPESVTPEEMMERMVEAVKIFQPFQEEMKRYKVEFFAPQGDYEVLAAHPAVILSEAEHALGVEFGGRRYFVKTTGKPGHGVLLVMTDAPKELVMKMHAASGHQGKFFTGKDGKFCDLTPEEITTRLSASMMESLAAQIEEKVKQMDSENPCPLSKMDVPRLRDEMGGYLRALSEDEAKEKLLVLVTTFFKVAEEFTPNVPLPAQLTMRLQLLEKEASNSVVHLFHIALHLYEKLNQAASEGTDSRLVWAVPGREGVLN